MLILHELTHTYAGGLSQDYPGLQTGVGTGGFLSATSVGANQWNSAETLAYMGLISKLIQLGFSVDFFGGLHPIPALAAVKWSLHNMSRFDIGA